MDVELARPDALRERLHGSNVVGIDSYDAHGLLIDLHLTKGDVESSPQSDLAAQHRRDRIGGRSSRHGDDPGLHRSLLEAHCATHHRLRRAGRQRIGHTRDPERIEPVGHHQDRTGSGPIGPDR